MNRDILQKIIRIIKLLRTHDNDQEAEKFEMVSALEAALAQPDKDSAAELRRLHEVNQELVEALQWIVRVNATDYEYQQKARSAITKATGESNE